MGFPAVVYSEMPSLLLHLLFLLGHLRRVSTWLLRLAGADVVTFDYTSEAFADDLHYHDPAAESRCGGGLDLEEHSPAVRFDELSEQDTPLPEGCCAVCLGDFHGDSRVRRPAGCRHVFHRGCLDHWATHGHRTCPLCRAPLLPVPPTASLLNPMPLPAS